MATSISMVLSLYSLSPAFSEEISERKAWLREDIDSGFGYADKINLKDIAPWVLGIGGAYLLDNEIRKGVLKNRSSTLKSFANSTDNLGNIEILMPASLALYGAGLYKDDTKLSDASFTAAESLALSGAICLVLKATVERARPYTDDGKDNFRPFKFDEDYSSFPSFSVASAFAFFGSYAEYYDSPYNYIFYGLATTTAFARVYKDKHWASDTVASAMIGTVTAKTLSMLHKKYRKMPLIGIDNIEGKPILKIYIVF